MLEFLWRNQSENKTDSVPTGATCFSYHQSTGIRALLCGFLVVALVEATTIHILLSFVNHWLALAATLATVYFALQVIAQIRAVGMQPMYVHDETLKLRNGAFDIARVPVAEIATVELTSRNIDETGSGHKPLNVTFPAGHNVIVKLNKPNTCTILNRSTREFDLALLAIDNAKEFKSYIGKYARQ
ncbi:hypothetical protein N9B12_00780 [bacterium]|nr:hypothetical protein [Mariniblastus sp.]MDA7887571.1 hypothetical protein [bacterium]MDB4372533.1 hypothetical protein [Mariniblastus sp.]MDB4386560.1 hypothetical protein [bacterium]